MKIHKEYKSKAEKIFFSKKGFSVLEIILAVAIFSIFSTAFLSFFMEASQVQMQSEKTEKASLYAEDGLEKIRAIRDYSYDDIIDGSGYGIKFENGKWALKDSFDEEDGYRREIVIEKVNRDAEGNIISENGTEDLDMKKISVNVFWNSPSGQEISTSMVTYLSRWK